MAENKTNPFDPSDEANYNTWQHGYNSLDKDDCPYNESGTLEYDTLFPIWNQGFAAGRQARKAIEKVNPSPAPASPEVKRGPGRPKQAAVASKPAGATLTEEELMEQLRAIKRPQYEALKAELAKLSWLFEE